MGQQPAESATSAPPRRLQVALLALPEVTAGMVYSMYDLFVSAGRDWDFIVSGTPGSGLIDARIVSADGEPFHGANGLRVEPQDTLEGCARPDVICIPDLMVPPGATLEGRYGDEIAWMRAAYRDGATLATACSGALVLAAGGLLEGCEATIHWGYCDAMAKAYPGVRVRPERSMVITGEEQRILMAGGGTSWHDLALMLVARFCGVEEAMRLARVYLIDWHDIGQQPFAFLARARQVEDGVIARCQEWAARNYDRESPVAAMVALSGLPERSFARRFTRATGLTPMAYIQTLRLEEAKQMLEATDMPVEAVANEVGYEDPGFFGRLFKRRVGLTPARYRRRFGGMRRALGAAAGAPPPGGRIPA